MPLSAEEILYGHRARRLLADDAFHETVNGIVGAETERAMFGNDPTEREAARQIVLALGRMRAELEAAVQKLDTQAERDALEREFEDVVR